MESALCPPEGLKLIETLRWDADSGFLHLDAHLDRMAGSAAAFEFSFDRDEVEAALKDAVAQARAGGVLRCRATWSPSAGADAVAKPIVLQGDDTVWRLHLSEVRLAGDNPWLAHKTTARELFDKTRAAMADGIDEVIFANTKGEICEGTITNVFARIGGLMFTPPVKCGLLPGVLRAHLLAAGTVREAVLKLGDLNDFEALFVGNDLRGLIRAELSR